VNVEDWLAELASLSVRFLDVITISFTNGASLDVYVPFNLKQRQLGLAGLQSLSGADGMLFVYDSPTYAPFSMIDMLFDLDVAWFDRSGKLLKKGSYKAGDPNPLVCHTAFSYVLECPAGTMPSSDLKVRV